MNSNVTHIDFLKKEEEALRDKKASAPKKETKKEKMLRLESLIEQGLYAPDMEEVAEALIEKLVVEEEKTTKK